MGIQALGGVALVKVILKYIRRCFAEQIPRAGKPSLLRHAQLTQTGMHVLAKEAHDAPV